MNPEGFRRVFSGSPEVSRKVFGGFLSNRRVVRSFSEDSGRFLPTRRVFGMFSEAFRKVFGECPDAFGAFLLIRRVLRRFSEGFRKVHVNPDGFLMVYRRFSEAFC